MSGEYTLPPLPPRPQYHWLESQLRGWQQTIKRQRSKPLSGGKRIGYAILDRLVGRWIRSGRKFPLPYRLWYLFGRIVLQFLPPRETANSHLLRRMFTRDPDSSYRSDYVAFNFITAILILFLIMFLYFPVGESAYILLTYRHDKYTQVMVTSHFPDRSDPHQFGVYGYRTLEDGEQRDIYMQIGPSFWFQEYNPANVFAKVSDNTLCDFDAYGFQLYLPLAMRYLSKDSLFSINPWIVDVRCKTPSILTHSD